MSLSPTTNITDGVYQIFSVAYPGQDADLSGGATSTIAGYENNDSSKRMQWLVTNVFATGPNDITLTNQEIVTHANVLQTAVNTALVGDPSTPMVWTVTPTDSADEFMIVRSDAPITWTLADGNDGTTITVEPIAVPPEDNQLWQFVPVN